MVHMCGMGDVYVHACACMCVRVCIRVYSRVQQCVQIRYGLGNVSDGFTYLEYLSAFYVVREVGHSAGTEVWLAIGVYPVCYFVCNLDGITSRVAWEGTTQVL